MAVDLLRENEAKHVISHGSFKKVLEGCLRGAWDFGGAGSDYAPKLRVLDLRCFLDAYRFFFYFFIF
jgi:hypothetical protein